MLTPSAVGGPSNHPFADAHIHTRPSPCCPLWCDSALSFHPCRIEQSLFYQNPASQTGANRSKNTKAPLTKPAWAALFTGAYITAVGLAVLLWPVKLFGLLFNVKSISTGWIRVGGVLAMVRKLFSALVDPQSFSGQ